MRRHLVHWSLLVVFVVVVAGCSAPVLKSAGKRTNVYPAMWEISAGTSKVYLFGSFHSLPAAIEWYGGPIATAFESSDQLIIESIDSPDESRKALQLIEKQALLPDGKTLDEYVDVQTFALLMDSADQLGLSRWRVSRSQPWFLSIMFAYEGMSQAGILKEYGVDSLLEQAATRRRIRVSGLETTAEGLQTLANEPLNTQIRRLQQRLNDKVPQASTLAQLFQAWAYGDEEGLARLMRNEMTSEEYQRVLVTRNKRWLPRLQAQIARPGNTMVVVGAAHLVGEQSLISMLRSSGYQITRIQ